MFKRILMFILNLLFQKSSEVISNPENLKEIIVIRTDERLGEIILTLPLINHIRSALKGANITFLMCKKYEGLSKYIDCNNFLFFEKRDLFLHPLRFIKFFLKLRANRYDLAILGGKIDVPSLTAYLILGLLRSRYKAAIEQKDFNPFINLPIKSETESEAYSKYLLAKRITGAELPFNNSIKIEKDIEKTYDVMIFTDARKKDHLLPLDTIKDIMISLNPTELKIVLVSGKDNDSRILRLKSEVSFEVQTIISPNLDELIKIICMSRSVIVANTGVLHLSVALGVPTCGIFVNADPSVWGYNFEPHLMIDARNQEIDINRVVNFILCSIRKPPEEGLDVLSKSQR